ncbi:MAG: hypothetical protein JJT88_04080 [Gammaproteobacteria bacterium]|nr:hypothetical protein [Gammaproteobacteria bacterium]
MPWGAPPEGGSGDRSAALVVAMAGQLTPEDVQLYYQIALMGQRDLPFAPDPRSGFEMTLLRMLAFRPEQPGDREGEAPRAASAASGSGQSTAAQAAASSDPAGPSAAAEAAPLARASAAAEPALTLVQSKPPAPVAAVAEREAVQTVEEPAPAAPAAVAVPMVLTEPQHWHDMVNRLELSGLTAELVNHCMPVEIETGRVRLLLDPSAEALNSDVHVGRLEVALAALLGRPFRVEIHVGAAADETPAQRAARERAERQRQAEEAIASDANVRTLIETFNASVQRESIRPMG